MGAWGYGAFDNDDASDFLADLEAAANPAPQLADALAAAGTDPEDHLEAPEASTAIAAAAVLAVSKAGEVAGIPYDAAARIRSLSLPADDVNRLTPIALSALERVIAPGSELLELWEEADEADQWRTTLEPVRAALRD